MERSVRTTRDTTGEGAGACARHARGGWHATLARPQTATPAAGERAGVAMLSGGGRERLAGGLSHAAARGSIARRRWRRRRRRRRPVGLARSGARGERGAPARDAPPAIVHESAAVAAPLASSSAAHATPRRRRSATTQPITCPTWGTTAFPRARSRCDRSPRSSVTRGGSPSGCCSPGPTGHRCASSPAEIP